MTVMFVHGVPDTPHMWTPLLKWLDLPEEDVLTPALPGFVGPTPPGFTATKEAYVGWLINEMEVAAAGAGGPINIVGHDWGALLTVRAVCLRPDLVRTWVVSNALPDPEYKWHRMARLWQTPWIGELVMALSAQGALARGLAKQGVPADIALHEAKAWSSDMKRCILSLYRSAVNVGSEWDEDLRSLPVRGLILWGDDDPYVPTAVAERFSERWGVTLNVIKNAGHWALIEHPEDVAGGLKEHWAKATKIA